MKKKDILIIENLAAFEKLINRDNSPYDIDLMVMPGTLEEKHKDVDQAKGIQALRRQFNLIYILLGGVHDVHLGAEYRWLKPNDLVIVPENMVYASSNIKECTGYCIHFKTEFLLPMVQSPIIKEFPFLSSDSEHIINLTSEESILIQQAFKDIIVEYKRFSYEKDYLLRNYIYILLLRIREIHRPYAKHISENAIRSAKYANEFKRMVERNFLKMREVQQYAEKQHISPKHLSDSVKEIFGKSPKDLINDMLLLEAKVQLGSTDKTITEIALELNFSDQSHFTNFIKRNIGCSPLEYRQKWARKS
ncbi:MAG TPA: helix-turn-helix domain-containing protein [Ignavibacteriaceae bacterium]|nr:helix-turn-helix domain-containing protein [Ignavibacteriaceae bacterium]